ncbi:MAG: glycosyltransferase family 4 protein [Caulobacterales bacterium]|nr:glycosyltransferase family 4 protein [Caulobacterales bacterium]
MVKVAYFSNQFADAAGHGLARYARELFAELRKLDGELEVTPTAAWSSMDPAALTAYRERTGLKLSPLGRRLTPLAWAYLNSPPLEWMLPAGADVVHAVSLGYPVATRKPLVVTVHDLGPLTHPEFFTNTRPWVMERSLAQTVRQADAIICVSKATADEVRSVVGRDLGDRVRVVYEGVSPAFFEPADESSLDRLPGLPDAETPFILATGKIGPRKNIQGVLAAMAELKDVIPHHLVLVGGDGWDADAALAGLADPALQRRVHMIGYVGDDQLRALYHRAALYVHPSLYEGFGLTVLEAMATGTPVVTSDRSALPEVAGDAARLVDPTDPAALAAAIRDICEDAALRDTLISRGIERARAFRWDECARQVAGVYREVA